MGTSPSSQIAQRFANDEPPGCLEGAFLHLQRWKGEYKRLSYGGKGMARLQGRRFVVSPPPPCAASATATAETFPRRVLTR